MAIGAVDRITRGQEITERTGTEETERTGTEETEGTGTEGRSERERRDGGNGNGGTERTGTEATEGTAAHGATALTEGERNCGRRGGPVKPASRKDSVIPEKRDA